MGKKIHRTDWKYLQQNPEGDAGFSEEKNRQVIENTIRKTDRMRRQKRREFEENLQERTWAAAKYLKNVDIGGETDPIKFFGKDYTMYLKGKEVMDKLAESLNAPKLQENTKAVE